ncbi:MAG: PilZ domain-containing protein [Planctomycetes bacterium]|nr:PilZ domain-containing protein [Planctomycetota bacterium]
MTEPSPQKERRRAPRALADFPIRLAQDPTAEPAVLRDISEIGLSCVSPRELPEMTLVGFEFHLPGAATTAHSVVGAVVRCEPLPNDRYDVAVYFTELRPETRAALAAFVADAEPAQ